MQDFAPGWTDIPEIATDTQRGLATSAFFTCTRSGLAQGVGSQGGRRS